ncbi:MAG TPA: type II secretion system F family protein [Myxococcales bacterium]|jgi:tight adherence protein C|nr:type II secretion system F family protein [Myxococcales bacterium]
MSAGALGECAAVIAAASSAAAAAVLGRAGALAAMRFHRSVHALGQEEPGMRLSAALARLFRRSVLARVARLSGRILHERVRSLLASWLRRAGDPASLSPEELVALAFVSAAVFFPFGVFGSACLDSVALAPIAALFGATYPLLWLRDRMKARRTAISRALPYDLDLLTLSVEAGLDFAAALEKVVAKGRPGPLADELSVMVKELRLGTRREEALRSLAARVAMPSLTSFAHALVQADRMGTPLAKVLRVLATQLRVERTQRAEKLASEAPVKLLLPLIGCIFPTIFLMLFGPIAWEVYLGGSS